MLSKKSLKKLYFAMVHPHFLYCLPVYSFTSAKNINSLFKKQKQCIRVINKVKYNAHTEPLFFNSGILPLEDLIVQQKLLFMHAIAYNYSAVKYEAFRSNTIATDRHYGLRNDNDFFVPRAYSSTVSKMPLVDFPLVWNNLDISLKDLVMKNNFKNTVKQQLLDKYVDFRCNRTVCYSCMNI